MYNGAEQFCDFLFVFFEWRQWKGDCSMANCLLTTIGSGVEGAAESGF
jgi:hypothetical protein